MGDIQFVSGNLITDFGYGTDQGHNQKGLRAEIDNLFKEEEVIETEKTAQNRKTPIKEITPQNLRELESQDIKDSNWERVQTPKRASDVLADMSAIRPSRSEGEHNYGGSSTLSETLNTILNPDRTSQKAGKASMSDIVVAEARKRRSVAEAKGHGKTDWDNYDLNNLRAKSTNDIQASQMGFTPNKSSFGFEKIPKVEIPVVEQMKKMAAQSKIDGKKAAHIKSELDKILAEEYIKEANDQRPWDVIAADKISEVQTRNMEIEPQDIKVAADFVGEKTHVKAANTDFSEWFTVPKDPAEVTKEASIKKDLSHLSSKRARREDDRSWEVVQLPKKSW